jgi:hypothetical protein
MKLNLLILLISLASCTLSYSQTFDQAKFLDDYYNFRYSLHPTIDSVMDGKFGYDSDFMLELIKATEKQTANYIEENKKEIEAYKDFYFNKYKVNNFSVDTSLYQAVEIDEKFMDMQSLLSETETMGFNKEALGFMTILPNTSVELVKGVLISSLLGVEEIGTFSSKNLLASAKTYTVKQSRKSWTLISDDYSYIFVFAYNFDDLLPQIVAFYKRK